ncbi:hypothetical protein M3Y95_00071700 [Aphelenchoides besseyi]|nr:hypothetical protein M3Y95_00071700 [Aphelenchoides besseyi]
METSRHVRRPNRRRALPFKSIRASELLFAQNPSTHFHTQIPQLDELISRPLHFGKVFEFCGERHCSKIKIAHRIIADFLLTKKEIPHRVVVFDYAYQFNTPLLDAYLSSWANAEAPLVSEALSNVSVQRVYNWSMLQRSLQIMNLSTKKELLWQKYRENATLVYDFVVIMDIGSLLQDTIYCRQDGLIVQDKIYKELEHLRHSGASVMLLNFSKPQLIFDPMYSVLGRNWSKLMRPRIYLDRSEQPNGGNVAVYTNKQNRSKGVFFQLAGDF